MVAWLARALVALGHDVTLVSARGSRIPGVRQIDVDPRWAESREFAVESLLSGMIDLVHYFMPAHQPPERPYVETVGTNLRHDQPPRRHVIYVSRDHARRHGGRTFVYNGIDPAEYRYREAKDNYLLFLGRLHRVKGYREAMEIAWRRRERLVVAGGWRLAWRPGVRYVGKVGGDRKARLLAGARALLAPIRWDEPFGLVVLEALVSGTPVLGTPRGAFPELVSPEVGALAETVDDLVAALDRVHEWSPERCRAHVLERFTHLHMARAYLAQYRHLLEHGELRPCV